MKRLLLLVGVSWLAGCAVGPDYEPPEVPSPAAFGDANGAVYTAAEPVLAWWQALDDPLLDQWMEEAVLRNHDIRIAETNIRAARAVLGGRKLERWPIATTQFSALKQDDNTAVLAPAPSQRLYDVALDASWEIDFFGRVRRSVQAAVAEANAAAEELRDTFVVVSAELARTYFEVKGARYRLSVAERNAENQRQTFELTQALLEGGRGTDLDIARARAQLESTLASIPPIERDIDSGLHRLAVLLGESPNAVGPLLAATAELPPLPALLDIGDPAGLLRRRADVRFAERTLEAETARVGVAVADLFPRVSLLGSVGFLSTSASDLGDSDTRMTSFGPFLSWPAFDLGRVRANVRVANAKMEAALLRYEQTVLRALEETENALFGFTSARTRQARLEIAAQASQQAADLALLRYRDGVDSFLTVLDAERRLLEVQDQLAQSATDTALAFVLLYKALGGGWQAVDERLQVAD